MSSHRRRVKHFARTSGPRKALIRGLVSALVEHGRIKTTVDKAKELRRHVEKAITLGKKGDLATTRLLLSRYPNVKTVQSIVKDLSVRFKARPGGYTRIIKIGRRPGDTAEMAFIEFVDYDYSKLTETDGAKKSEEAKGTVKKVATKGKKVKASLVAAKKKTSKKIQKKSRAAARA